MKLEINLNGNLLDYVDEEEIKRDVVDEIKTQIKVQIQSLINDNKDKIQNELVDKIVKDLLNATSLSIPLNDILYKKILEGIENRYKDSDTYNIYWDLSLSDKLKSIYEENKIVFDNTLKDKLDKSIKDYKVDNYVISREMANILTYDNKYQTILKDFLDTRIDEILDKI